MRFAYLFNTAHRAIKLRKIGISNSFNFHYFTPKCYSKEIMSAKPPNILVYTGCNSLTKYNRVESDLIKCLGSNSYIVYHLLPSEINDHLWMKNALLLVVVADTIDGYVAEAFETYFKEHGNILIVCTKFTNPFLGNKCDKILNEECLVQTTYINIGEANLSRGKYSYCSNGIVLCWDSNNKPLIWKIKDCKNTLILSEIYLINELDAMHRSSVFNEDKCLLILKHILKEEFCLDVKNENECVSRLSPGYFFNWTGVDMVQSTNSLNLDSSSEKSIFSHCDFKYENELIKLPVYNLNDSHNFNFDRNLYFANLHTDIYGHSVIYFPTITTTMEAAKQLSGHEGIVIIADCQISGRGRGTNKWISPVGCAMFTLNFTVSLSSQLGKRLPLLQHIAALAVIHGIKNKNAYKTLDLEIKWPNDIYHGKIKLGGLIVTSEIQKDLATINVGWGINVNNTKPTLCINDVIDSYNSVNSCSLPHLSKEEIIAFTLSQMEFFVKDFMTCGSEKFFENYYTHWMHGNQRVTLTNSNMQGTVIGLDEFGFLKVKSDDGKILVFQPDGNRFDIMKNLIQSN